MVLEVHIPLYKAFKLSKEVYILHLDCNATPMQIIEELAKIEPDSLLPSLIGKNDVFYIMLVEGLKVDYEKSLRESVGCIDNIKITLIPALEGG